MPYSTNPVDSKTTQFLTSARRTEHLLRGEGVLGPFERVQALRERVDHKLSIGARALNGNVDARLVLLAEQKKKGLQASWRHVGYTVTL